MWLDPAYRLVQLQRAPWDVVSVQTVLENSTKLKDVLHRISQDAIPKLAYLLQRPLVRIAREAQRFARGIGVCGKSEITGALWVVLSPWLANNCVKGKTRIFTLLDMRIQKLKKTISEVAVREHLYFQLVTERQRFSEELRARGSRNPLGPDCSSQSGRFIDGP